MTASPSSSSSYNVYDEEPPVNPYREYSPTSRQFTTGSFPVKTFQAQNGAEIRVLYGVQLTGKRMTLTYVNVTDTVAWRFMQHYIQMRGSYTTFLLQGTGNQGARAGWGPDQDGADDRALLANPFNMRYRYAEEPQITSVHRGRSTVTIQLIAVPKGS